MAAFVPIDDTMIQIADVSLQSGRTRSIAEAIVSLDVSLTMDGASEISFEVIDLDFAFAKANYFQIRRDVLYQEMIFEISVVEVSRSESVHPRYKISARNKNIQMMKRDKSPEAYKGTSASDFARIVASKFSMNTFIQETTKKQSIVKGRSGSTDESVWDVLTRSASDAQFVCFEVDNILFFCSQQHLLGKWGDPQYSYGSAAFIPFVYPEQNDTVFPGSSKKYLLMDMPEVRRSDDNPMDAEGSMVVERTNGRLLRPGMTIWLGGIPDFEGFYLITAVEFSEGVPDPVRISFRSPVEPEKVQENSTTDMGTAGTGSNTGNNSLNQTSSTLPAAVATAIRDFINKNLQPLANETPDSYSRRLWDYAAQAIKFAQEVYYKGSATGQREMINAWAASFAAGRNDVRWRAVNSQASQLSAQARRPTTLPSSIYDKMFVFIFEKLGVNGAGNINKILNKVVPVAALIYKTTSRTEQEKLFAQYKDVFGGLSPEYLTLNFAKPLIAKPFTGSVDRAFPTTQPIQNQRYTDSLNRG